MPAKKRPNNSCGSGADRRTAGTSGRRLAAPYRLKASKPVWKIWRTADRRLAALVVAEDVLEECPSVRTVPLL